MNARKLLPSLTEVREALGPKVTIGSEVRDEPMPGLGTVVRAAALESAYRRYDARLLVDDSESPVAISAMSLVFDGTEKAARTFAQVAQAAHLRTAVEGAQVAVETVTTPRGLVSYWGFLHRDSMLVILTLDTVDPQHLSIADLRALVSRTARRLSLTQI